MIEKLLGRIPYLSQFLIEGSPLRKKLIAGFAWSFTGKALLSALGVVLNIVLARILPPEQVGEYFLALSVLSVVSAITLLGVPQPIVKLVSESLGMGLAGRARKVIKRVMSLVAISSLVGGVFLAFGGGVWLSERLFESTFIGELSALLGIWLVVSNIQKITAEVFRGFQDLRWASLFGDQGPLTRLIFVFALIVTWVLFSRSSLYLVLLLAVISNIITLFAALLLLRRPLKAIGTSQDSISRRELHDLAWPFWVNSLGFIFLNQADTILLGVFRPEHEVALYSVVLRLSLLALMPLMITNAVLRPVIAQLYSTGQKKRLERLLRITSSLVIIPAVIVFIVFLLGGRFIINGLYGSFYEKGFWSLVVLSFGQVINVATGSSGLLLNMSGFHKSSMAIIITIAIVEVGLLLLIAPTGGVLGVAVVVAFSYVLKAGWSVLFAWRKAGIRTWPIFPLKISEKIK